MTISQAARRLGVAEKQGRIPYAKRRMWGWRVYSEEDIGTLKRLLVPETGVTPSADVQ